MITQSTIILILSVGLLDKFIFITVTNYTYIVCARVQHKTVSDDGLFQICAMFLIMIHTRCSRGGGKGLVFSQINEPGTSVKKIQKL